MSELERLRKDRDAIQKRIDEILNREVLKWDRLTSLLSTAKAALEHYASCHYCAICGSNCASDRTAIEALAALSKD